MKYEILKTKLKTLVSKYKKNVFIIETSTKILIITKLVESAFTQEVMSLINESGIKEKITSLCEGYIIEINN